MIRWNVRTPEEVTGDIRSQVAANHVCGEKIIEMMTDEGLDTLEDLADEIIQRTEQSMRRGHCPDSRRCLSLPGCHRRRRRPKGHS